MGGVKKCTYREEESQHFSPVIVDHPEEQNRPEMEQNEKITKVEKEGSGNDVTGRKSLARIAILLSQKDNKKQPTPHISSTCLVKIYGGKENEK